MSALLAEARREVLAFFRRRDGFWILAGFGAVGSVPLAVLAAGLRTGERGPAEAFALSQTQWAAEVAHNYTGVVELVAVVVLAYALASRSLGEEIERGSWLLLRLTPAGVEQTLGGKALGIAVVLASAHGLAASLLMLMTPFLRRTHAEVASSTLGALLVAFAAIPEGFAHVSLGHRLPGGPVAFRVLSAVRVGLLLAVLAVSSGPPLQRRPTIDALVLYWLAHPGRGPDGGGSLRQVLPAWVLALAWLALSGAVLWKLVVRRWRSVDR